LQQCQPVVEPQFEVQSEAQSEAQVEFQDDKAQLSYRGVNYESSPATVEVAEVEVTGKYRGQVCKVRKTENIPVSQPTSGLKYRGATVISQASPTPPVEESKQTPES
jgi:NADPH-dependent glutamate synthase beta subunit-like oxidoreductase